MDAALTGGRADDSRVASALYMGRSKWGNDEGRTLWCKSAVVRVLAERSPLICGYCTSQEMPSS
jgi:hypothetical protein